MLNLLIDIFDEPFPVVDGSQSSWTASIAFMVIWYSEQHKFILSLTGYLLWIITVFNMTSSRFVGAVLTSAAGADVKIVCGEGDERELQ